MLHVLTIKKEVPEDKDLMSRILKAADKSQ